MKSSLILAIFSVVIQATLLCGCPPDRTMRDAGPLPACLYEMTPVVTDGGVEYFYIERQFDRVSACVAYEQFCNEQVWPVLTSPKCTPCCDLCNVIAGSE